MLLATLAVCSCALPGAPRPTTGRKQEGLLQTTLPNGLRVVLIEDHSAPVVALNVWVRTGSAEETDPESGMAHVFEHMLFKGTERRAVGEIASTVEAAGGDINAFTSYDMTVYHITMAARDAAVGVDVLADAIRNSTFDAEELAREKPVILEEIRRGEDSPSNVLYQALFSTAYQRHPYRRDVIGTAAHVESFTREQMLDFHRRWYVPNNMTFVAAGDLEQHKMLAQIQAAFAGATARRDLAHPRQPEPVQPAPRARVVRRPFEQTLTGIAFPITAFEHPDTAYVDLLAIVLGGGDSSRLYRNVKDRERLVHAIHASSYTPVDPGVLLVDAALEPERMEETLQAISSEIDRLRSFGPSEAEVERARVNLLAGEVHEKETMEGQARKYGFYVALTRGLEAEKEYLDRIRRATVEDVRRVAVEYLRPERASVVALVPEKARPELDEARLLAALELGRRGAQAYAHKEVAPGILRYELPNGLRVVVKRNAAVPLVSVRLAFLGGSLAETERTQGISSFAAEMLSRGTEQRSAGQIAAEVEGIAGSLSGFSGRNSFGVTGEFLRDSLDTGLELFADVLLHSSFPAEEIEKLRSEQLAAIKRKEDNLATRAFELFGEALYPGHPYRFSTMGTEKTVKSFKRDALAKFWRERAVPANGVLAVVGDVDSERIVESIQSHLAGWSGPAEVAPPERRVPPRPRDPREIAKKKGKQQVHLVFGFLGLTIADTDQPALEVLTQILSGQGGRLFLELRDKRSLAYSVSAFNLEGLDPGAFGVYIASAPDKLEQSLAGVRSELDRILREPIDPTELERAKAYLIGSHAVGLQRFGIQAALLSSEELYGLGAAYHTGYASRIEAVGLDDVQRVARRLIDLDAPVIGLIR
jgi:zinc protease